MSLPHLVQSLIKGSAPADDALAMIRGAWGKSSDPDWMLRAFALGGDWVALVYGAAACAESVLHAIPDSIDVPPNTMFFSGVAFEGPVPLRERARVALEVATDAQVDPDYLVEHARPLVAFAELTQIGLRDARVFHAIRASASATYAAWAALSAQDRFARARAARFAAEAARHTIDAQGGTSSDAKLVASLVRAKLAPPMVIDAQALATEQGYEEELATRARRLVDAARDL